VGELVRTIVSSVASTAVVVILTALTGILDPKSPVWFWGLWVAVPVLVLCVLILVTDTIWGWIKGKRSKEAAVDNPNHQRELIRAGRQFVITACAKNGIETDFKRKLEAYPQFFKIRPHLSQEYRDKLDAPRTVYVPRDGTHYPALANWFLDELDRLEKEWGLR
jgi:hypothetical protein